MGYPVQGVDTTGSFSTMLQTRHPTPRSAAPASQAPINSDAVLADVAKTAALLRSIVETANGVPTVDQARVVSLQQAIVSGTIQANPRQIAQSLSEFDVLLIA
jgi:anti-sigma28 factor (negative regulator of flagellin synthesis)